MFFLRLPDTGSRCDVLRGNVMDVICSSQDQDDEITRSLDLTEVLSQVATCLHVFHKFPDLPLKLTARAPEN